MTYVESFKHPIGSGYKSGWRKIPEHGSVVTALLGSGLMTFIAHDFIEPTAISAWGVQVSVAGNAGSVVRIGRYLPQATATSRNALAGGIIASYGTVPTATIGYKEIAVNEVLYGRHFLVAVAQNITTTAPTLYAMGNAVSTNKTGLVPSGAANLAVPNPYQTGITAALPATATDPPTLFTQFQYLVYPVCA